MTQRNEALATGVEGERKSAAREMAVTRLEFIGDRLVGATTDDELRDRVRRCRVELEVVESMLVEAEKP